MSHHGNERTSMTTMAREYMSDSFVAPVESSSPSNMDSRSGAIHLMVPASFTAEVEECDSVSAVMEASPKSHRTALLLLSMRTLGYVDHMSDSKTHSIKFTYSF